MEAKVMQSGLEKSAASVSAMEDAMSGFGRTTIADLLNQADQLAVQAKSAAQIDDTKQRAVQMEIINSNMEGLLSKISEYREDTAELIAGLEATFEKLGHDLSQLQKPLPEDLKIVDRAREYMASLDFNNPASAASLRLSELQGALTETESAWNPIGKAAKVAEAKQAVESFRLQNASDVAAAQTAIVEAQAEVERLRRKRIREADFDKQFERFIALASQIQAKLLENVKKAEIRMVETRRELNESLAARETLAGDISRLQEEITTIENDVMALESSVATATSQEDRARLEKQLGDVTQRLADMNGKKQEMEIAFNSFEAAVRKHETMLSTIQVQCDNQRSHARKLSVDSKARFVQAQNLVLVIQNTSQEDAASRIHSVGSTLDRQSMEIAARALVASERERLKMYQGHESDMKGFAEITGALAEGRAAIAIEDAEIAARMQQNFGINPLDSSWLHIAEKISQGEPVDKAA